MFTRGLTTSPSVILDHSVCRNGILAGFGSLKAKNLFAVESSGRLSIALGSARGAVLVVWVKGAILLIVSASDSSAGSFLLIWL